MSAPEGLLTNRVAVITGGANGIGAAIARCFAAQGAVGAVLDQQAPRESPLPDSWAYVETDVCDQDSVRSAFAAALADFGRIDVVVANAGVVPTWTPTSAIDVEEWARVLAINATGVMLTVREGVRVMQEHGGAIVAMSSLNGWRGDAQIASYVASKHAVVGLVRSVALDVGRFGIRVNAVAPGPIATDALLSRMKNRAEETGVGLTQALERAGAATALGRMATVNEVANAVLFLASDLSSGITGHLLPVDAGIL